jgi:uncharacterized membrane protein
MVKKKSVSKEKKNKKDPFKESGVLVAVFMFLGLGAWFLTGGFGWLFVGLGIGLLAMYLFRKKN